jgi:hypothetical protein
MKVPALFLTSYLGLALALFYTFFLSEGGFLHVGALGRQEVLLEENVAELRVVHSRLADELRVLSSDAETVRLLARELGYYRQEERVMRVMGLPATTQARTVGRLVRSRLAEPPVRPSKTVPVLLFLAPNLVLLIVRLIRRNDHQV